MGSLHDNKIEISGKLNTDSRSHNVLLFVAICFCGLVTGCIATARGTDLLGLYVLFVFASFFSLFLWNIDKTAQKLIILAFLLRLGLALIQAYVMPLPSSGADAIVFEQLGWQTAEAWFYGGSIPALTLSGAFMYSLLIGILYYIFGRIPLLPQFVNVLLGSITVYLTWKIAFRISGNRRASLIATMITALFPTLTLYSAITLRESIIIFFTAASIYCFFLWLQRGRLSLMFGTIVLLLPASILHGGMVFIEFVYIFFFCLYHSKKKKWTLFSFNTVIAISLFVLVISVIGSQFSYKFPEKLSDLFSSDYLSETTTRAARDRAAYLSGLTPTSTKDIVIQIPLRVIYFLFAPFPWMVSSPVDIIGLIDAFLYILLSVYAIKGLKYIKRKDKASYLAVVLILVVFLIVFAWGTSNYGTAIRHRQKIVWFLTIPASMGIAQSSRWKWLCPEKKLKQSSNQNKYNHVMY